MKNSDYYNASGCADPTAHDALGNVRKRERKELEKNVNALIKEIKATIAAGGFTLQGRIVLKDIKSGAIFK